jgi:AcrR family transcriptional regulator
MATQQERRESTRTALLEAGARLFAERGVHDSTVDAIAAEAGRTSGALYDHFGGKDGLLFALLEGWVDDVAVLIAAELLHTENLPERMATLWRNISDPSVGNGRWIALEHELWSYAVRNPSAAERLVARYRAAWDGLHELVEDADPSADAITGPPIDPSVGPTVLGLVLGLEMMRRIDPNAVDDTTAVAALCAVVGSAPRKATTT